VLRLECDNIESACRVLEMLPLVRTAAFTPRWLALDYAGGRWSGEFGY